MTRRSEGWIGALGQLFGVGATMSSTRAGGGAPSAPPQNLAQAQHGFSAANPGPAWSTWDSYPTYVQTQTQYVTPYTAACGQWSSPLGKSEIDGYLYSTAVMLVEHANGQPVTQQTRDGIYLFALENEMVTVRKCLSQSVPIQQAKFTALAGLAGLPIMTDVGLSGCGSGCTSCPFCRGQTNPFGGVVVGVGDSCGHVHPAVCLPDPPAFPEGAPCGGAPIPMRYLHDQGRGAAFAGLGGCGGACVDLPQPADAAFTGVGIAPFVTVSPGGRAPVASGPGYHTPSTAGGNAGPPPPFAYQGVTQPGQAPDGQVVPLNYVPVAQQMPLRPPGKMAYQPTLPWWTAWHKSEQQAFDCWWVNQQFAQPVCGLGQVANFPATPDFAQLKWVLQMGIPFSSEIQCGLAALPPKSIGGKPLEALAILATAVGGAAAVAIVMKMAAKR